MSDAPVDIEGLLATLPPSQGGRRRPWLPGLRPIHEVRPGTFTSGEHTYPADNVQPGSTSAVSVRCFFPEVVEGALWVGKILRVQEGARVTGHLTNTRIHDAGRAPPSPRSPSRGAPRELPHQRPGGAHLPGAGGPLADRRAARRALRARRDRVRTTPGRTHGRRGRGSVERRGERMMDRPSSDRSITSLRTSG